jgi:hypothetical protein
VACRDAERIATIDMTPAFLWVRGNGPATFDVVAAILTALSEIDPGNDQMTRPKGESSAGRP